MPTIAIDVPKDELRAFCRKWKVTELALFGSVIRDDFSVDSDIDVLVAFAKDAPWSLLDMVDMQDELKDLFGRDVDLVERAGVERSVNRFRRQSILDSAVRLDVA